MKQLRFKTLLSLLALMTALFATSLTAQAQLPAVSIDVKNVSVKDALKAIEAESGYTFAYVDSEINLDRKVSVNAQNKSIASILSEILPGMNVELRDKKIVLTEESKTAARAQGDNAAVARTITGRVVD